MRGQTSRFAAVFLDPPQIAVVTEDDLAVVIIGMPRQFDLDGTGRSEEDEGQDRQRDRPNRETQHKRNHEICPFLGRRGIPHLAERGGEGRRVPRAGNEEDSKVGRLNPAPS